MKQTVSRESASKYNAKHRDYFLTKLGAKCNACGTEDRLGLDHITPITNGGLNEESNIQILCNRCNSSKGGVRKPYKPIERDELCEPCNITMTTYIKTKALRLSKKVLVKQNLSGIITYLINKEEL